MHKKVMRRQRGFTLVEIAIVLVIIGLILGAILKGQQVIKNAKTKSIIRSADELRAAVFTYQDRYGYLPGDDPDPDDHTGVGGLTAGDGNGHITGGERLHLFNHLAAAGIISGSYNLTTYPTHAFADNYYIYWTTRNGKTAHWIVYEGLAGDVGRSIDYSIDDGVWSTGSVRASTSYSNNNTVTLYIEF